MSKLFLGAGVGPDRRVPARELADAQRRVLRAFRDRDIEALYAVTLETFGQKEADEIAALARASELFRPCGKQEGS